MFILPDIINIKSRNNKKMLMRKPQLESQLESGIGSTMAKEILAFLAKEQLSKSVLIGKNDLISFNQMNILNRYISELYPDRERQYF